MVRRLKTASADVIAESLFEWKNAVAYFHGLRVEERTVHIGGRALRIASLKDAAALLDEPDFARRFLEEDCAPYGLELWPAAIMLAAHIMRDEPGDRRLALDLGCGLGLVAMAAAVHGWRVVAADHEPTSLRFAEFNARANDVAIESFEPLDWRRPQAGRRFDRIFAADVLYQRTDHVPILRCLEALLGDGGVALLADPRRGVADGFDLLAVQNGFQVRVLPADTAEHHRSPTSKGGGPVRLRVYSNRGVKVSLRHTLSGR